MATKEITASNFNETIKEGIVLLDFWASWCAPCRQFAPVFEAASEKNPDIVFGKVDTEAQVELSQAFGIMSIPTVMIFRDGITLYSGAGALPAATLDELIQKARDTDMDSVRENIH